MQVNEYIDLPTITFKLSSWRL